MITDKGARGEWSRYASLFGHYTSLSESVRVGLICTKFDV